MKPDKPRYHVEELVLVFLFLFFFLGVFIGSFKFRPEARFFPLVLSTPGLVLVILYLIRWLLPETINVIMEGESEFSFGTYQATEIGQKIGTPGETEEEAVTTEDATVSPRIISYSIILFSILYILVSYLIGFYISTVAALSAYFYISKRKTRKFILGNILLCVLLLVIIYTFDSAFGHHFGLGVLID